MQMKKLSKKLSILLLASAVAVPVMASGGDAAWAQGRDNKREEQKSKSAVITNKKLSEAMNKALEAMNAEPPQLQQALEAMRNVPKFEDMTSYERAKTHQIVGSIYAQQSNYKAAIKEFEAMIREPELPEAERDQTTYNLAQLYMAEDNIPKGVKLLETWFKTANNPNANAYFLLCQGYIQMERYKDSLKPCLDTIDVAKKYYDAAPIPEGQTEKEPFVLKEAWLRGVIVAYQQNGQLEKAAEWVKKALTLYPKREYWIQLVSLLSQQSKEKEEFAAYQVAHRQGLLQNENEYLRMASLYQYHGVPYKAAVLLDKAIKAGKVKADRKNLELLANSYTLAKEFGDATDPLAKAAALANEGPLWERLSQVYMEDESWEKAADALNKALNAGGLKDPFRTRILEGIALVNNNKFDEAIKSFETAKKYAETDHNRKSIASWVRFAQDEQRRYKDIKEYRIKRYATG